METCMTLGMLSEEQTLKLKAAGLDYYNHNVDTSEEYYKEIITTRTYADRLNTISLVQDAGINVCSGGIVGMGEEESDRAGMLQTLANLDPQPQSVPINMLVQIDNTPLGHSEPIDAVDFVRTIAVARILMPKSIVRLSAGREAMSEETQALCFFAGANSIFIGEELLTTKNPELEKDNKMFDKLGLEPMPAHACPSEI
jgi:biotin synthase